MEATKEEQLKKLEEEQEILIRKVQEGQEVIDKIKELEFKDKVLKETYGSEVILVNALQFKAMCKATAVTEVINDDGFGGVIVFKFDKINQKCKVTYEPNVPWRTRETLPVYDFHFPTRGGF